MKTILLTPDESAVGIRIDSYIEKNVSELTRSAVQKLCESEHIRVKDKAVAKNYKLRNGDTIEITLPPPKELSAEPQNIPVDIVYEDDSLVVVNKAKGMVVHAAAGNEDGTLVNALLYHCKGSLAGVGGVLRPGIVHRIDKDTSGLLVVAKTDLAHLSLSEQVKAHSFTRRYYAIVYGNFKDDTGTVDAPVGRHPVDRKKMCVTTKNAREAVTHYEVAEQYRGFSHLILQLETGRTHQIRVHMAHIGHPVAGDPVYGPKKIITRTKGQCLHAQTLGFIHPVTKQYVEFSCDPPEPFQAFQNSLVKL